MTVNLATKYASQALDAFKIENPIDGLFQAKYDWSGNRSVVVFTNGTAAMNNYTRTGTARYGTMENFANTADTLTVTQARSFTMAIDNEDIVDTGNTANVGAFLRQQINRKIVPDVISYCLDALHDGAATESASAVITSANAFTEFQAGNLVVSNLLVPLDGRAAICTYTYLSKLRLDTNFVLASDMAQDQIKFKGQVGMCDGVPIIPVADGLMNDAATYNGADNHVDFIIVHADAVAAPWKLEDYVIHDRPPGINGQLVEGLVVYDLFVLDALHDGVYAHVHA